MLGNHVYQIPNEGQMNNLLNDWANANYFAYFKLREGADPQHLFDQIELQTGSGRIITKSDWEEADEKLYLRPLKDIYYTTDVLGKDISLHGNRWVTR